MKDFVINSELINDWNWKKNNELELYPDKLTLGSNKKVWWICNFGHEWESEIYNRDNGNGCPYCSGRFAITGFNDLKTLRPDLIQEWDWDKNNKIGIYPAKLSTGSHVKAWWTCRFCGSSIFVSIKERTKANSCPNCSSEAKTSMSEIKLYYYLKKYFSDAIHSYNDKFNRLSELDIYIPSIKCGIEYDGMLFHKDIERDMRKDIVCQELNINLVRIREPGCPKYESNCEFIYLKNISDSALSDVIKCILVKLGINSPVVNFKDNITEINNLIMSKIKDNSLQALFPNIAAQWHSTKNGKMTPDMVSYGSSKKVWWLCNKCKNEWYTSVANRTCCNRGCPACARMSHCIAVYSPELNMSFDSINDGANMVGISCDGISACLHGRQKTAGKHPVTGERLTWTIEIPTIQN